MTFYLVGELIGYDTENITQDVTKSDGCLRKTVDNNYFKTVFPDFKYLTLKEGISQTIEWFIENYDICRK